MSQTRRTFVVETAKQGLLVFGTRYIGICGDVCMHMYICIYARLYVSMYLYSNRNINLQVYKLVVPVYRCVSSFHMYKLLTLQPNITVTHKLQTACTHATLFRDAQKMLPLSHLPLQGTINSPGGE